jgi:hypothetical protein
MQVSLMNNTKLSADVISEYVLGKQVIPLKILGATKITKNPRTTRFSGRIKWMSFVRTLETTIEIATQIKVENSIKSMNSAALCPSLKTGKDIPCKIIISKRKSM